MRCFTCGERLTADPEQSGARCLRCAGPLFEDPRATMGAPAGPHDHSRCAVHPHSAAAGTCQRCGNFMCQVCRTDWRRQALCLACVARALETKEASPAEARTHLRQAILGLVLGGGGWVLTFLAVLVMAAGVGSGDETSINLVLVGLGFLVFLAAPLPSLVGVGQAAAAIRSRGDHMIVATCGLLLAGLHIGVVLGFMTILVQNN